MSVWCGPRKVGAGTNDMLGWWKSLETTGKAIWGDPVSQSGRLDSPTTKGALFSGEVVMDECLCLAQIHMLKY